MVIVQRAPWYHKAPVYRTHTVLVLLVWGGSKTQRQDPDGSFLWWTVRRRRSTPVPATENRRGNPPLLLHDTHTHTHIPLHPHKRVEPWHSQTSGSVSHSDSGSDCLGTSASTETGSLASSSGPPSFCLRLHWHVRGVWRGCRRLVGGGSSVDDDNGLWAGIPCCRLTTGRCLFVSQNNRRASTSVQCVTPPYSLLSH